MTRFSISARLSGLADRVGVLPLGMKIALRQPNLRSFKLFRYLCSSRVTSNPPLFIVSAFRHLHFSFFNCSTPTNSLSIALLNTEIRNMHIDRLNINK